MSQTLLLCLALLVVSIWGIVVAFCFLRDLCWGSTRKRLQSEIQRMNYSISEDCDIPYPAGSVVLYHNWPHLVVETEGELRLVAFRLPYSEK